MLLLISEGVRSMPTPQIKLIDIARELSLSVATVNRAIRGYGRINAGTKARILAKAAELGYAPNMAASALSSKKTVRFAVICPDDFFFKDVLSGVDAAAQEYKNYGLETDLFLSREYKVSEQIAHLEKVIASGEYSGLLIAPAHPLLLNYLIEKAVLAGLPVVTMNNDAPQSKRSCFVGQNGWMAGKMCAEFYNTMLPAGARVAVFNSQTAALGLKMRSDGFLRYCQDRKRLEIVGPFEYNDTVVDAEELCGHVLQGLRPEAVFANNMMGSIGCALASQKLEGHHPLLIGFDVNDSICELIESDIIYLTILQDPFSQGYYSYKSLYRIVSNPLGGHSEVHYTHMDIVMKSNLEEYRNGMFVEFGNVFK